MTSYIIVNDTEENRGMIMCNDRHWRYHAPIGCGNICMKIYAKQAAALKRASKIKGKVIAIPGGYTVDAAGNIQRPELHDAI